MGTGTSRAALGAIALALGLAACGGGTKSGNTQSAFVWFHPRSPPSGWRVATIRSGATLAYPPSWQRQHSDAGTASAVLLRADGGYLGYLNLTPRQGDETLSNWASFRVAHNADEGDRDVKRLAAAGGLPFLGGRGSCVKDAYTTKIGAQFVEIACLIAGHRGDAVIVAAAPPQLWASESGTLQREIEAVRS